MDDPTFASVQPRGSYKIGYLQRAKTEARKILNPIGYAYAVRQAQKLRHWDDAQEMSLLRIEPVESVFELKLKGNVLGKINLRLFFAVFDKPEKSVVVLGAYKKEEEDDLPRHIVISMINRRRVVESRLRTHVPKGNES